MSTILDIAKDQPIGFVLGLIIAYLINPPQLSGRIAAVVLTMLVWTVLARAGKAFWRLRRPDDKADDDDKP